MSIDIVLSPDDRLRQECAEVEVIDEEVVKTAKKLARAMYKNDGCGIAAPQIGDLRQIVVIDCDWGDTGKKDPCYLINPKIVEASEEMMTGYEGCLSIPGVSFEIERHAHVVVQAYDLEGRLMQYDAENNLFCVCMQHEIDHLHGMTMFERLKPQDRLEAVRQYQAALAAGARPGDTEA